MIKRALSLWSHTPYESKAMASVNVLNQISGASLHHVATKDRSVAVRLNGYGQHASASHSGQISGYAKISDSLDQLQSASGVIENVSNFSVPKNGTQPAVVSAVKLFVQTFNAARRSTSDQMDVESGGASPGASKENTSLIAIGDALKGTLDQIDMGKLGLSLDKQGNLSLDSAKLQQALKDDPNAVKQALQGDGADIEGLGKVVSDVVSSITKRGGSLDKASVQLYGKPRVLNANQADSAKAAAMVQTARYQYSLLNMLTGESNSANSFPSSQLALLSG